MQFAYVTGAFRAALMKIGIFGTGVVADEKDGAAIEKGFDLRQVAIIRGMDSYRPSSRDPRLTEPSVASRSNSLGSVRSVGSGCAPWRKRSRHSMW